jgi:CHASE2 domain-containing sensor protein
VHTSGARILLASILQTAIWLAVLFFDPFGMSTAADSESENIYLRLYPAFYPERVQPEIHIVTIGDNDLPLPMPNGVVASASWPLSYEEYVGLIKKVLELRPRGVFVDLFFKQDERRPDAKALLDFLEELQKPGYPPVVFADFSGEKKFVLPEIHKLPFAGGSPLRGVAEFKEREHYYPLRDAADGISAAAVLYNATAPQSKRLALTGPSSFLVAWPITISDDRKSDPTCAPIINAWDSRAWALVDAVRAGFDTKFGLFSRKGAKSWEQLQPCPHHRRISARTVMAAPGMLPVKFEGAYIFIGADIKGSGDQIISPVHGEIPGVNLHAMALDNLLMFEGSAPFLPSEAAWPLQGILIFVIAVLGRLFFDQRPASETRVQALKELGIRAGALLSLTVAVIAVLLIAPFGPNNWGGVVAISAALFFGNAFNELFVLVFGTQAKERADE